MELFCVCVCAWHGQDSVEWMYCEMGKWLEYDSRKPIASSEFLPIFIHTYRHTHQVQSGNKNVDSTFNLAERAYAFKKRPKIN